MEKLWNSPSKFQLPKKKDWATMKETVSWLLRTSDRVTGVAISVNKMGIPTPAIAGSE